MKWHKENSIQVARDYVMKKNYEIQQLITLQIRDMMRQYNVVRDQAIFFKNEVSRLTEKQVGYE